MRSSSKQRDQNEEMKVAELKRNYLKHESKISREIRILAEVEKIWVKYDKDGNQPLEYDEISEYLRECAKPPLTDED